MPRLLQTLRGGIGPTWRSLAGITIRRISLTSFANWPGCLLHNSLRCLFLRLALLHANFSSRQNSGETPFDAQGKPALRNGSFLTRSGSEVWGDSLCRPRNSVLQDGRFFQSCVSAPH